MLSTLGFWLMINVIALTFKCILVFFFFMRSVQLQIYRISQNGICFGPVIGKGIVRNWYEMSEVFL